MKIGKSPVKKNHFDTNVMMYTFHEKRKIANIHILYI